MYILLKIISWAFQIFPRALTLFVGRTLGSIGLGNIGAEVFRLCEPLNMKFIAYDPYIDPTHARELNVELTDLDTVFRNSDFITVNVPLSAETLHLVNAAKLKLMKPSAYLINTSRGPVVEQDALVEALKTGINAGAGLDVFDPEPLPKNSPLWSAPNLMVMPHISADDGDTYIPLTLELVLMNMRRYLADQELNNLVRTDLGY